MNKKLGSLVLFSLKEKKIKLFTKSLIILLLTSLNSCLKNPEMFAEKIKENSYDFQKMLKTYALGHKGKYPKNVEELMRSAYKGKYWKNFENPFIKDSSKVLRNMSSLLVVNSETGTIELNQLNKGNILYNPIKEKNGVNRYYIYAVIKDGYFLMKEGGKTFYLTNN